MACPPLVPISVIPPVSQGVGPLVYHNGSCIARLNPPLNPSLVVYNGSVTTWGDGSGNAPIRLPNLQQVDGSSVQYLVGTNSSGALVLSSSISSSTFISVAPPNIVSLGSNGSGQLIDNGAKWIEIDICVDGTPMKMMILGTDPY